jgi:mannosyl-3-phosphoglycerate phosphatase
MRKLLVFTDLDGTLLDHDSYEYDAARPFVERLDELGWPLVLSSSKTESEIQALRIELDNGAPFVVENGSAILVPEGAFRSSTDARAPIAERVNQGASYARVREVLEGLRKAGGFEFLGFGDLDAAGVAEITGLDEASAGRARDRCGSEPLLWRDSEEALEHFAQGVREAGLSLSRGGRFVHVMGRTDKGKAVPYLLERFREAQPEAEFTTVALGDSQNDVPMLEAVDLSVVLRKKHGESLRLPRRHSALYTSAPGPEGWAEAMEHLIERELMLMEMEDG